MTRPAAALAPPPAEALRVAEVLHRAGWAAWFVGGCVRDRLIGRPVADWDVATDARPEAVLDLFERAIGTGLQHGTVTVVEGGLPVEVTTFRIEGEYTDGRRPDAVHFTRDLHLDLARRDFTMNAMAWDPSTGRIEDPFMGRADLDARLVRAVGDPMDRFTEDGLRPLRAVRFAAVLALEIEATTWAAIPRTLETFRRVSAERVQVELTKLLGSARAGWGVERLAACGLLGEILPEIPAEAFPETEAALACSAPDPAVRLALLLTPVAPLAEAILTRLRFSNALRREVSELLRWRDLDPDVAHAPAALRRLAAEVGRTRVAGVLAFHRARGQWPAAAWDAFEARLTAAGALAVPHAPRELAVDGAAVMAALGIPPSRRVGRILEALLERVWEDPAVNTRDRLLEALPEVARRVPE